MPKRYTRLWKINQRKIYLKPMLPQASENFPPFDNRPLDNKLIDSYKSLLCKNIIRAFHASYRNVDSQIFTATHNNCHDNANEYCQISSGNKQVRGWICIENEGISSITLASHSVILSPYGELFDITPLRTSSAYKFLPAFLDDLSFDKLVLHLYKYTCRTNLHIEKPT